MPEPKRYERHSDWFTAFKELLSKKPAKGKAPAPPLPVVPPVAPAKPPLDLFPKLNRTLEAAGQAASGVPRYKRFGEQ